MIKLKEKETSKKNITLLPIKAVGGNIPLSTETIRGSEKFSIPGLHGELYAFDVEENSMTPFINHGDKVICRQWYQQYDELRKDAAYVIITPDGARVKRIERKYENSKFTKWTLKSDNPTIYPVDIDKEDVMHIFCVVKIITTYSPNLALENLPQNANVDSIKRVESTILEDTKEGLKHKIANNRIAEVINELIKMTDKTDETYNLLFVLKSRIKKFSLKKATGCLTKEDENIESNNISKALLDFIDLLD